MLFESSNNRYPYLVGEISANHANDIELVKRVVSEMQYAGFDALKLQTYTADELTAPGLYTMPTGLWKGRDLYELYSKGSLSLDMHKQIYDFCKEINFPVFSTPFSLEAVDFLETLNTPAYKIASFEITYLDLIKKAASTKKPVIISTGMSKRSEIEIALKTALEAGAPYVYILKCTSSYPCNSMDLNLGSLKIYQKDFVKSNEVRIGFSDHGIGVIPSVVGAVLGAKLIEKHVCLSKSTDTLDKEFSLELKDFRNYVKSIREAVDSAGEGVYYTLMCEIENKKLRRSIHNINGVEKVLRPNTGKPL